MFNVQSVFKKNPAVRILCAALLLWALALPAFAQTGCGAGSTCLENPLKFSSLERFIEGVLQAIVMIALPIIVAFIVYAGFKYIFARGNASEIGKAHENFKYVIIGTILILGAWVLATLIGGTVSQLLG
jgi:hypothetical protein